MNFTLYQELKAKTLTYSVKDSTVLVKRKIYDFIKQKLSEVEIVRVCIHTDSNELTQLMLIGITRQTNIEFHKNENKDKLYHLIQGNLIMELENQKIRIDCGEIFKLGKGQFARMYTTSDIAIYHEIVAGPFNPSDTIYR